MRNEYVVAILHTALHIVGDSTEKEFSMRPQQEIIGEESSGRVDYAIKAHYLYLVLSLGYHLSRVGSQQQNHKPLRNLAKPVNETFSTKEIRPRRTTCESSSSILRILFALRRINSYGVCTEHQTAGEFVRNQLEKTPGEIAQASDTALTIEFTKKALEKNSEEYEALCKGVKKDRACVGKSPATKRARVEGYRTKK
ncbi:11104_t:CDS:2 [Paraglomus brasilianum]|uniref:11104_t:CDS:1 n=1 Tax=Paraglomus brasilianum TaxID=144538 RepID=A0A9N9BT31_9GLOM|nr:11104_t:CDS:2 [Paraglomus brasilianum]